MTASWTSSSGVAFQWHFIHSENKIGFLEYIEDLKYDFWETGKAPAFEAARDASRAFVGWINTSELQLSGADFENVKATSLGNASKRNMLKGITMAVTLGKSLATVGITASLGSVGNHAKHNKKAPFHEMIVDS